MLKELEDYGWFPALLRRWQMDFIGNIALWTKLYKPLVPVLEQIISKNNATGLQDTCSGSGMPAVFIHGQLIKKIPMLLTDKYPPAVFKNNPSVTYVNHAVDINELQPVKGTIYTMFNAFHHFSAEEQNELIKRLSGNRTAFLFAEILEPGIFTAIKIFFTGTILQLLTAPFVKPFSLARLIFTYIIPVNLFTVTYDGIISVIKSKTVKQYQEQLNYIASSSFVITVHQLKNPKGNVVYIKGEPINI